MIYSQVVRYRTKQAQITYHLKTVFYKTYKVDTTFFYQAFLHYSASFPFLLMHCFVPWKSKAPQLHKKRNSDLDKPSMTSAACLLYHTELQTRLTCKLYQENVVIQDLGGNKGVKSRKVMVQSGSRKEEKSDRVKGCGGGRCGIPFSKDLKVRGMKP